MVKLTGPLFSLSARGMIGQRIVYSERKTGSQVRFQKAQKDVASEAQLLQREKYNLGVTLWRSMPKDERDLWVVVAGAGFVDL